MNEVVLVVGQNRSGTDQTGEIISYYAYFPNGPSITGTGDTPEEAVTSLLQYDAPAIQKVLRAFNYGVKLDEEGKI